jgi:hypothetical protein
MEKLREQLLRMSRFMEDTPDPRWYRDETYWAGPMPSRCDLYDPREWQMGNHHPIICIWYRYLLDLHYAAHSLDSPAMKAHLLASKYIRIDDLLSASREVLDDYYLEQVNLWESQYLDSLGGVAW